MSNADEIKTEELQPIGSGGFKGKPVKASEAAASGQSKAEKADQVDGQLKDAAKPWSDLDDDPVKARPTPKAHGKWRFLPYVIGFGLGLLVGLPLIGNSLYQQAHAHDVIVPDFVGESPLSADIGWMKEVNSIEHYYVSYPDVNTLVTQWQNNLIFRYQGKDIGNFDAMVKWSVKSERAFIASEGKVVAQTPSAQTSLSFKDGGPVPVITVDIEPSTSSQ
ncbi:MAG: hypothetical protein LBL67_00730 [Coriobacteriales bacterium]|jgi:hypothetical protein|nr:hypothetical protein [Coriobacteriales bacterium]